MVQLKFKRHWYNFYVLLACGFILFIGVAALIFISAVKSYNNSSTLIKPVFLFSIALILLALAIYSVVIFFKATPRIFISGNNIIIGREKYSFEDIAHIELFNKIEFPFIITFPMTGSILAFKNGSKVNIYHKLYSSSWRMKLFIEQVLVHHGDYAEPTNNQINAHVLAESNGETFRISSFVSGREGFTWIMIIVFVTNALFNVNASVIFFTFFCVVFLCYNIYVANYFQLNAEYLVVRNNYFGTRKIYSLKNIREVAYEPQWKQPISLRVITKNHKEKLYQVALMDNRHWESLKKRLEADGISTRDKWDLPKQQ